MGDDLLTCRSDKRPSLAQSLVAAAVRSFARKAALSLGMTPLRLLAWAYAQELREIRQSARKQMGAGKAQNNWADITGMDDPADALVLIETLERLGTPTSRNGIFSLIAKNADSAFSQKAHKQRTGQLKDFHRAPPASIRTAAEERISRLPTHADGLKAVLVDIADRNFPTPPGRDLAG